MQIFSGKDDICSLLAVNRCKNVIRVSLLLGWDERCQKDKPEERRNCGCRRERLFNRFKRRSDPRLSYEAQSQKNGKVAKSGSPELRPRQSRRARRSCIAFGWCESSSPRGSSIVPGLRGGRSSYSQSASEGTRRIGAITLRRRSRDTRSHDERPNARELLVGQPRRGVPDADHGVRSAAPELCRCRGVQQASRHVHGRQRCAPASPGPRMFTTSVLSRGRGDLFFIGSTRS